MAEVVIDVDGIDFTVNYNYNEGESDSDSTPGWGPEAEILKIEWENEDGDTVEVTDLAKEIFSDHVIEQKILEHHEEF
jgi:hypothetical protein